MMWFHLAAVKVALYVRVEIFTLRFRHAEFFKDTERYVIILEDDTVVELQEQNVVLGVIGGLSNHARLHLRYPCKGVTFCHNYSPIALCMFLVYMVSHAQ